MIEVARTHDAVRLSYLKALLEDAGVAFSVFDTAVGGTWPSAFPARLMVADKDAERARSVLAEAPPES